MEQIFINIILLLVGFIFGYNWKKNKKLKMEMNTRICTNIECNPKGYANCLDFDSCEERTI